MKVYQRLSGVIDILLSMDNTDNPWRNYYLTIVDHIEAYYLPQGSGFNTGSHISMCEQKPNRIKIHTSFEPMNEAGFYLPDVNYVIKVTPSLAHGFELVAKGPQKDGLRDYVEDCFVDALDQEYNSGHEKRFAQELGLRKEAS